MMGVKQEQTPGKRAWKDRMSPSMNRIGWSALYGHPVLDVETVARRYVRRPAEADGKALERRVRDVLDLRDFKVV